MSKNNTDDFQKVIEEVEKRMNHVAWEFEKVVGEGKNSSNATEIRCIIEGRIITPIVIDEISFQLEGAECKIINSHRVRIGKLKEYSGYYEETELERLGSPDPVIGYMGELELRFQCISKAEAKQKISTLLAIDAIGALTAVGMGQVRWINGRLEQNQQEVDRFTVEYKVTEKVIEGGKEQALKAWQDFAAEYKRKQSLKRKR
ncbi:MAG: hypothetical protein ACXACI_14285 [Candidatus Hodarchaeales archaeon]|jgi:hypothetical protein